MKKKKLLAGILAAAMSLSLLAGCAPNTDSTTNTSDSGSTGTEGTVTPSTGPKEAVINLSSEPPELNSLLNTSTGGGNVLRHIIEGLVVLNEKDEPVPGMAEKWDISEDKTVYTFHIRKDAKWTNGDPVTAHDFVFAWNTLFTPATAAQYGPTWATMIQGATESLASTNDDELKAALDNIGYKALDDYTFEVKLTGPYPYFLSTLTFYTMAPLNEKAYTAIGADKYAKEATDIVTNGPFKMTSWEHESEIVLEKNEDYYAKDTINLTKLTMVMIADTNAGMNSFKAGDVDMIGLTGDQAKQLTGEGLTVQSYDEGSCWYFEFQTAQKGLNNAKVRQALTLAIDAQSFIDNIVKNSSTVADAFTSPAVNSGEYAKTIGKQIERVTDNNYDSVKALLEEGLKEEGMTTADLKLAIITDEGDSAAKNCAFFQEQWKTHLGVEATVEQMPYKARLERMKNKEFSVVMAGWSPDYNDPMTYLDLWLTESGNNHTSWSNSEYDRLIKEAYMEADVAKRTETLITAEKILLSEMPIGPIYNRKRDYVCSERLVGVSRTAFSDIDLRHADIVEAK